MLKYFLALWIFISCIFGRELWLLNPFESHLIEANPQAYLWSEKLDGIHAYWDGEKLYSRGGKVFNTPKFFTQHFPPFAIEGELWSKREDFENILSIVKSNQPQRWRELKFYIFEVPNQQGGILDRLDILANYLNSSPTPYIQIIPQTPVQSLEILQQTLDKITLQGGEGIVVREKDAPYYTGRKKTAMKMKKFQDRECKITRFIQGKGKFEGMIGSFLCQDGEKIIKIGSGMDENFRKNPPPIGTIITYKFFGYTRKGNPRFPTFLRIRSDSDFLTHYSNKGKNENQTND